jgi:hypothetical protein
MTDEFDPHLSCSDRKASKYLPGYISKLINFDSIKNYEIKTPFKSVEANSLSTETLPLFKKINGEIIFDNPKYVWNPQTYNAIHEMNEGYVNNTNRFLNIIGLKPTLTEGISNALYTNSVVFHRNPFEERLTISSGKKYPPLDLENFETFLNNLYAYSKGLVSVPDINIANIPKKGYTITPEDYQKHIEFFINVLSSRNNKPIFVPIQTNLTQKATKEILEFYRSKKYSNIWVNFSGGEVRGRHISGFRSILNILDKQYPKKDYVLLCSHMRKEISPDVREDKVPASDMLSQFVGGDIIGGTREPAKGYSNEFDLDEYIQKKGFSNRIEYEKASLLNKSRIFDPNSYYYYLPNNYPAMSTTFNKSYIQQNLDFSNAIDNIIKYHETEYVKKMFSDNKDLKIYLKNKKMFNESEDIYNDIVNYKPEKINRAKSLFDF